MTQRYEDTPSALVLKDVFSFTDEDLVANRAGQITPSQHKRLKGERFGHILLAIGGCVLFPPLAYILLPSLINDPFLFLLMFGLCAVVLVYPIYKLVQIINDIKDNRLVTTQGVVTIHITRGKSSHYEIIIRGQTFSVAYHQCNAFIEGEKYRLHHLPRSKMILSVRRLST
jgi:hypothetical protein